MARQQHGGTGPLVVISQKLPHSGLRIHIQSQGGLIKKQHIRLVQQGSEQLSFHALAQRQLSNRTGELLTQLQ